MKKFYSFALAALCALSAAAAPRTMYDLNPSKQLKAAEVADAPVAKKAKVKKMTKVAPKADDATVSIEGTYDMEIGDFYITESPSYQNITVEVKYANKDNGVIIFDDVNQQYFTTNIAAIYNESQGTITFVQVELGETQISTGTVYYKFSPFVYIYSENEDEDGEVKLLDTFDATFDNTTGTIEFLSDEGDMGFAWPAYTDEAYTNLTGWFGLFDVYTAVQSEAGAELIDLGTAEFVENIAYPLFNQGAENTTVSKLNIKTDGQGTYYLADPLQATYSALGFDGESPEMVIDATDPDNIRIPITGTSIVNNSQVQYVYFSESYYSDLTGEALDDALIIKKEVEGDKVTIVIPYHSTTIWSYNTDKFYYGSGFVSTLTFTESHVESGVDNVAVDSENAPVEYYNLLGNRVTNPAKGQIIIKKQGTTVTKMIVR
ncbi:MAG: hypothetical protein K2J06_02695 [Muribaculaceae bacterium]|nr:hypothetical protein [Muribaculaceae bacterium]